MTSETAVKKNIQKLQRAIVDGLEDVKAQDIQVFNTEVLSPLFERVIIASGTSNRQTKALAASVRDAVREAGFDKPRTEGEENGEWIIVDCGAAVVHVMQPSIRQYYRLEEIWGDKPVRLKHAAQAKALEPKPAEPKPAKPKTRAKAPAAAAEAAPRKTPARKAAGTAAPARSAARPAAGAAATKPRSARAAGTARTASAPVAVVKVNAPTAKKAAARKSVAQASAAAKPAAKKAPAKAASAVPRAPRKTPAAAKQA
ncbi:ribosome silencing factor [Aquabacterium sp. A08]|uniref:ribosome silencing factor n=1 Tax=Aquabacterium sp. A08 TaxID=2718532 RepID=UPI001423F738|nr:ribosome silencing factor [Aquabacterium sp. A08]NIC40529.1 ribosome silencing factor [Aquabacterium sp. A08]